MRGFGSWKKASTALASAGLALVSALIGFSADVTPAAANTWGWCSDPYVGGVFLCQNGNYTTGEMWQYFPNYSRQVFVIGQDWSLWTRWNNVGNGGPNAWSSWYSMGGKSECCHQLWLFGENTWTPEVVMVGTDGRNWYRNRYANGSGWTGWKCCAATPYPL